MILPRPGGREDEESSLIAHRGRFGDEDIEGPAFPTLVLVEGPVGLLKPHFLDKLVGALNERFTSSGVCTALAVTERSAHDSGSAAPGRQELAPRPGRRRESGNKIVDDVSSFGNNNQNRGNSKSRTEAAWERRASRARRSAPYACSGPPLASKVDSSLCRDRLFQARQLGEQFLMALQQSSALLNSVLGRNPDQDRSRNPAETPAGFDHVRLHVRLA